MHWPTPHSGSTEVDNPPCPESPDRWVDEEAKVREKE